MNMKLTNEVFERIINMLDPWACEGVNEEQGQETLKYIHIYLFYSFFKKREGEVVDIEKQIKNIKEYYNQRILSASTTKLQYFKKLCFLRQFSSLKEDSLNLSVKVLNSQISQTDAVDETRKLLGEVQKLSKAVENEEQDDQVEYFEYMKEIFMNCMFTASNDLTVIGNEVGELYNLMETVKKVSHAHRNI